MSRSNRAQVSTAYLLTCAAIGVAGGIVLAAGWWISSMLFITMPLISVAIAGLWLMPAVIALRLIQRPFAGLLVGLISGLVLAPLFTVGAIGTTLWWALFAELGFLLVLYRFWRTWQHYASALIVSIVYPIMAAASFDLWTIPLGMQIAYFGVTLVSCFAGTWLGIVVADRLRTAGVAKLARRRTPVAAAEPAA
jgi:energy-coupling factor transport system substrate-specific component